MSCNERKPVPVKIQLSLNKYIYFLSIEICWGTTEALVAGLRSCLCKSVMAGDDYSISLCCVGFSPEFLPIILIIDADDDPSVL